MKTLFFRNGLLRSGWRVSSYLLVSRLLLLLLFVIAYFSLAFLLTAEGTATDRLATRLSELATSLPGVAAAEFIQVAVTIGVVYFWRHRFDHKSVRSLGLSPSRGWWKQALMGAAIAGLIWTCIFIIAAWTRSISIEGLRLQPAPIIGGLLGGLGLNLIVALNEELDARGYVLQNLAEGVGFAPAVILSALYFGLLHFLNPGANWTSTLGVALFGVFAALVYRASGQLWMPIGMHAAWNFFEGPVFGFPVSGLDFGGLFILRINGPEWFTGGTFGPEAGLITMIPLAMIVAAFFLWERQGTRGEARLA